MPNVSPKNPKPGELVQLAALLFGPQRVSNESSRERMLADALVVWKDARKVIARGGVELDLEGSALREEAQEWDQIRTWEDDSIRAVWDKEDTQSAVAGKRVLATPDAARKALVRAFGSDYGNAVFYAGREFGLSRMSAYSLKRLTEAAREKQRKDPMRPTGILRDLVVALHSGFRAGPVPLGEIGGYLPARKFEAKSSRVPTLAEIACWVRKYVLSHTPEGDLRTKPGKSRTIST